jgi:hypothetical protein
MSNQMKVSIDMKPVFEEADLRSDVSTSMKQIDEGQGVSHPEAKAELLKRLAG